MKYHRRPSGLLTPEKELIQPGLCSLLTVNQLVGFGAGGGAGGNRTLLQILTDLSLTSNLKLCFDAGDSASYGGSGQTWTDRGGTQDFWFGADGGSSTDDPSFNGSPGGLSSSEYMGSNGGDFFRAKAQPAFIQNVHKNNARWAGFAVVYQTGNNALGITGTTGTGSPAVGFDWILNSGVQTLTVGTGGAAALYKPCDSVVGANVWNFLAVDVDEATGAGGGFFRKNKAYDQVSSSDTWDATYSSPSASSAAQTVEIGARGNGDIAMANGSQKACFAFWQGGGITEAEFDAIYDALNGERGFI